MTAPFPRSGWYVQVEPHAPTVPLDPNRPTWCTSCEIHRATSAQQICPVCVDKRKREASS